MAMKYDSTDIKYSGVGSYYMPYYMGHIIWGYIIWGHLIWGHIIWGHIIWGHIIWVILYGSYYMGHITVGWGHIYICSGVIFQIASTFRICLFRRDRSIIFIKNLIKWDISNRITFEECESYCRIVKR
jgi:hypothetical protein